MKKKEPKNTLVVNLFGGPGISKSTTMAGVFNLLKLHGVDCETSPEFAKEAVWENRLEVLKAQNYIFGKQYNRLYRINGKVDVVITDSPLLLTLVYAKDHMEELKALALKSFSEFNNINYLLKRVKPYNPNGRTQTKKQAIEIDHKIKDILVWNKIKRIELNGDYTAINTIVGNILFLLEKKQEYFIEKVVDNA